ncbi:hypothetical protein [Methanococcus voltae]|uniref:Uncharacterized protein n=1 Tax=Methanococcus voltae (strain ATCC BAA-1334 / A3) TaxID=456320 RepID=D7DST7_METV3|nr:hypothetical protein [Methanococcus voltae]MCS3901798.1 hypothetical protein [Methanococcus voltae]
MVFHIPNFEYCFDNLKCCKVLHGFKEWADYKRYFSNEDYEKHIVIDSKALRGSLNNIYPEKNIAVKSYANPKEFIEYIFETKIPVEYNKHEHENWIHLLDELIANRLNTNTFQIICLKLLNGVFLPNFNTLTR